jgi:hypothetical protein
MRPKSLVRISLLVLAVFFVACGSENTATQVDVVDIASGQDGADTGESYTACERGEVPLTVTSHSLEGQILALEVSYDDACATHGFAVWWSGTVATSNPPLVPLEFHHYVSGETCGGTSSSTVTIDLSGLDGVGAPPSNAVRFDLIPAWPGSEYLVSEELYAPGSDSPAAPEGAVPITVDCGGITG